MCVVPSGKTTSSSVRSPTTMTRGVVNAPTYASNARIARSARLAWAGRPGPPPRAGEGDWGSVSRVTKRPSFGGQVLGGEREVEPARLGGEVSGGVPDGPEDGHPDHELQRELAGDGKGGVDDGVEEELVEEAAQHE